MKYVIIFLLLLDSNIAWGKINCKKHTVYCAVIKLRPDIDKVFAMKLSNHIYHASQTHKVDKYRLVAIMQQESSMNMTARNYRTISTEHTECDEWERCITTRTTIDETTDFGLFQFNRQTIIDNNLNIQRIMTDMEFTINFAAQLLAHKIKICKKPKLWPKTPWACYNSATPKYHKQYVELVNQYYNVIAP